MSDAGSSNVYLEYATKRLINDIDNRRVLTLDFDIDDGLYEAVTKFIIDYNVIDKDIPIEKRKPIYIYLACDGGDVVAGLSLLSVIEASKTPVYTVVALQAFSMAVYVAVSGQKRYAFKNSLWLIHDGAISFESTLRKAKDQMTFSDKINEKLDRILLDKTKLTKEQIEDNQDREWYLTAEEAKEYGLVDYLIGEDCEIDVLS